MENYNPNNPKYIPQNIGFAAIMLDVYRDGGNVRDF
jgi:hypothetical protein